jgi:Tfp pilus assembly protein PilN
MIEINLLPEELRKKEESVNLLAELPIKRSAVIVVIVFFGLQILATLGAFSISAHSKWMKAETVKLREMSKEILAQKALTALIKKRSEKADAAIQQPFLWSSLLNALSDSITKGVWLTHLSITNDNKAKQLRLDGSLVGRGEETALAGKFIKELKSNPLFNELFNEIELVTMKQKRIKEFDVYDFEILCNFKKGKF